MSTFATATSTGTINGTNTVFTFAGGAPDAINVFLNGDLLQEVNDFTLVGTTITFNTNCKPISGDSLQLWVFNQ